MGWNVSTTGTHAEVTAAVDADAQCPAGVKSAVKSALGAFPAQKPQVSVSTNGHIDPSGGSESNATITIKTV